MPAALWRPKGEQVNPKYTEIQSMPPVAKIEKKIVGLKQDALIYSSEGKSPGRRRPFVPIFR
jgi:hypothetical protein